MRVYNICIIQLQHLRCLPCISGDRPSSSPSTLSALLFSDGSEIKLDLYHVFYDKGLNSWYVHPDHYPEKVRQGR